MDSSASIQRISQITICELTTLGHLRPHLSAHLSPFQIRRHQEHPHNHSHSFTLSFTHSNLSITLTQEHKEEEGGEFGERTSKKTMRRFRGPQASCWALQREEPSLLSKSSKEKIPKRRPRESRGEPIFSLHLRAQQHLFIPLVS